MAEAEEEAEEGDKVLEVKEGVATVAAAMAQALVVMEEEEDMGWEEVEALAPVKGVKTVMEATGRASSSPCNRIEGSHRTHQHLRELRT